MEANNVYIGYFLHPYQPRVHTSGYCNLLFQQRLRAALSQLVNILIGPTGPANAGGFGLMSCSGIELNKSYQDLCISSLFYKKKKLTLALKGSGFAMYFEILRVLNTSFWYLKKINRAC